MAAQKLFFSSSAMPLFFLFHVEAEPTSTTSYEAESPQSHMPAMPSVPSCFLHFSSFKQDASSFQSLSPKLARPFPSVTCHYSCCMMMPFQRLTRQHRLACALQSCFSLCLSSHRLYFTLSSFLLTKCLPAKVFLFLFLCHGACPPGMAAMLLAAFPCQQVFLMAPS